MNAVLASRAGVNRLSVRRDYQPQVDRVLALAGLVEGLPNLATLQGGKHA
jgi:hypothetical protein